MVQVTDLENAIRLYYEKIELTDKDIGSLFGTACSTTIHRLKKKARQQIVADNIPVWNARHVNTRAAFKAWGLDIADLEHRLMKLRKLGFIKQNEEAAV